MKQLNILFICFNRPAHTKRVFEAIRAAKPSNLYICADGPRNGVNDDLHLCGQVREIVSVVDWDCRVHRNYQTRNLGCRATISNAINEFFGMYEDGIILEDDCLPSETFFQFCQAMLERFRLDERVMQINGTYYLGETFPIRKSYYFSKINSCWGWATWRRAWEKNDFCLTDYIENRKKGMIERYYGDSEIARWMNFHFEDALKPYCKVWSTAWAYSIMKHDGLCVNPTVNLVENIGFDRTGVNGGIGSYNLYNGYEAKNLGVTDHPRTIHWSRTADIEYFRNVIRKTDPALFYSRRIRRAVSKLLSHFYNPIKKKGLEPNE